MNCGSKAEERKVTQWAASLPLTAAAGLGPLRFLNHTEALLQGETVWLRGQELNDADELRLRQIPGVERFQVSGDGELFPAGSLLPCGRLPAGTWQKLKDFLQPRLPPLRIVAGTLPQISLSLVRVTQQRDVGALLTTITAWEAYALSAPQVRLQPLKFAMNAERRVLIVGTPLPPLLGELFWEANGIFIAAGWCWSPAVEATIVRRLLQLSDDDVALWPANGQWELIRRSDFVAARRAAVRATAAGATKS
jgi:hypothetical protein